MPLTSRGHRAGLQGRRGLRRLADAAAVAAILAAATAEQPVIREAAVSSLKLSPNRPIGERAGSAARATLFGALDDPRRLVRLSALASIINVGGGPLGAADEKRFGSASREFAAKARLYQDNAKSQSDLGTVHLLTGEFDLAAAALANSISLEPDRPTTTFLLALARLGQQRYEDGRALLKRVPPSDPYYKTAQERLKKLETSR